jgi:hypothetical protein
MSSNDEPTSFGGGGGSRLSDLVSRFISVRRDENGIPRVRLNIVGLFLTSVGTAVLAVTSGVGSIIDGFVSGIATLAAGLATWLVRWIETTFGLPRVIDASLSGAEAQLAGFGPLAIVVAVGVFALTAYAVAWGVSQIE